MSSPTRHPTAASPPSLRVTPLTPVTSLLRAKRSAMLSAVPIRPAPTTPAPAPTPSSTRSLLASTAVLRSRARAAPWPSPDKTSLTA
ncbi:hypothetical protein Hypma_000396 [Hypsizygus marmoreus]|uniref:Uncharacterized protein n=1 Tax=Hypsizygus marmoreus TaxID=39966 RepID=A0A369JHV7_HYPMA|nr:hypothetical protein Hypma_000396 [Hypsizygus marmoreus]